MADNQNQTTTDWLPQQLASAAIAVQAAQIARDDPAGVLQAVDAIKHLQSNNVRMLEALTEIANRAGVDRGAEWARARAKEGLRDE